MAGNTKLPASDDLEDHPHPFRDMTVKGALTRSFLPLTVFTTMPLISQTV